MSVIGDVRNRPCQLLCRLLCAGFHPIVYLRWLTFAAGKRRRLPAVLLAVSTAAGWFARTILTARRDYLGAGANVFVYTDACSVY